LVYSSIFEAIVNGIFLLILFSVIVSRKEKDFLMFILYAASLLEVLITSKNFLVESLESLMYWIRSYANIDNLISLFYTHSRGPLVLNIEMGDIQVKQCPLSILENKGSKHSTDLCTGEGQLREPTVVSSLSELAQQSASLWKG
jgi:hypothetical protein